MTATTSAAAAPLLKVDKLTKHYITHRSILGRPLRTVQAVDDVSFHIDPGETLSLVGESGCGKSTIGRTVLRLVEPTSGAIWVKGRDIVPLRTSELHPYRREMQIIFQDPFSSLNPRMRVSDIVAEPLVLHGVAKGSEVRDKVADLFRRVGLRPDQMERFPHEFSGGQRQRIGIARALALGPSLIIGDEPVSALDVSVQAQVINLMMDLQQELGLSYLFIAHDLSVVRHISHRIAVMYLGRIVETATSDELFANPTHPYTEALLSAVPLPDPRKTRKKRIVLKSDVPNPADPPTGCRFHTRCPIALSACGLTVPKLREVSPGHAVACHLR